MPQPEDLELRKKMIIKGRTYPYLFLKPYASLWEGCWMAQMLFLTPNVQHSDAAKEKSTKHLLVCLIGM